MKIEMLNLGWMTAPAGLWRQGDEEPERPLRLPVPAYLIETESERILVDTGLHPNATTDAEAHYGEGTALGHFDLSKRSALRSRWTSAPSPDSCSPTCTSTMPGAWR